MNLVECINYYGEKRIPEKLMRYYANSGSGFDKAIEVDWKNTSEKKVTINGSYHRMDDNGYYCGWVDFKVEFTPVFGNTNMKVIGVRDSNLKEYISDSIRHYFVDNDIPWTNLTEIGG